MARPGNPAPEPTSTTCWPSPATGIAVCTTAQLSTCRSQSRAASRGPISPWLIPVSASTATNSSASASRSPNTDAARSGVAGTAGGPLDPRSSSATPCSLSCVVRVGPSRTGRPVSRETRRRSGRQDDDVAVRLDALGLGHEPGGRDLVVDDLALEGRHRLERGLLARGLDLLDRRLGEVDEGGATLGPVAGDVEHEAAALTGLDLDREARQLLESLEHLAPGPDETARHASVLGVDDRDGGAVAVDVHVDVTVEVGDVEQRLEEVGGDLTLT